MNQKITEEDLRHKGFPFECENCGNKPTPEEVVRLLAMCAVCGENVIAYTIDTAELLLKLQQFPKQGDNF